MALKVSNPQLQVLSVSPISPHLDFQKYFLVSNIAITNVNNTIIIIISIIKIPALILIALVKKKVFFPQTQGKVKSGEFTRSTNWFLWAKHLQSHQCAETVYRTILQWIQQFSRVWVNITVNYTTTIGNLSTASSFQKGVKI